MYNMGYALAHGVARLGEGTVIAPTDFQPVLDAMTAQVSVSTIVTVVAAGVTASIGLVFMWWGVRKVGRAIMGAFRKGKLSI